MRTSFMKYFAVLLLACAWGGAHAQTCVTGAPGVLPTASLTFPAVTLNTDGTTITNTPVTYNLYQGASASSLVKVATAVTAGVANTISTGLIQGSTVYWSVTAVDSKGAEGAQATPVCKSFAGSIPGTTTITIK
jgi:hypothetical protein